ncbi:MAG: hypothetical protein FWG36_08890 [Oscillospiraceae bacterium]|nr:hypothetical protein [Oscillospiraceae bacterium]
MKSPLRHLVIRMMTNILMYTTIGMFIHVILADVNPDWAWAWNTAAIVIIIYCGYYAYTFPWKYGERDRNLVKYNHIPYEPKRGFIAGGAAIVLPLASMLLVTINDFSIVKVLYITVIILVPFLAGFGYINGHKLMYSGISIVYRKNSKSMKKKRR